MAAFSIWHCVLVLLIVLLLFRSRAATAIRWTPLFECGGGLLIAWLLFAVLR